MENVSLTKIIKNNAEYHHSLMEESMIDDIREWLKANFDEYSDDFKEGIIREVLKQNKEYISVDYGCSIMEDHIVNSVLNDNF